MTSPKLSKDQIAKAIELYLQDVRNVEFKNRLLALRRLQDLGTSHENRFLEDEYVDSPDYLKFSKTPARFGYLSDGRRVWLLGEGRVRTLCGVSEVLWVPLSMISDEPISAGESCVYCHGAHVQRARVAKAMASLPQIVQRASDVLCGHCDGVQVGCSYYRNHFAFHCSECGWFVELVADHAGHFEFQSTQSQRNFEEEHVPQSDFEKEDILEAWGHEVSCEQGDCEDSDEACGQLDGDENECSAMETQLDEDQDSIEDPMDVLIANFHKLWSESTWKSLRNEVLTMSILGHIAPEKVDMVWMTISSLLESCRGLSKKELVMFVKQLSELSRIDLIALIAELPSSDEDAEPIMPIVQLKIQRWINGCQSKVARFRVQQAGIKILAPKIGVAPEVLQKICQ